MPKFWSWVERQFAWLLLVAGAILLLANLGNIYLWQDEAETALLSQRLGMYGLPLAFDGRNLIRQAPQDVQYTDDYVWVYHPWFPFYLTALSFTLLGPTTFAARLPYALAGLATFLLLYHSIRRHFHHRRIAMLSASFLLLCVPFLLHARQCKYFPFAALFAVAVLDSYLWLLQDHAPGFGLPYFVLAGFLLFQSNFGAFIPLVISLGLHFLLSHPSRVLAKRMALTTSILLLLTIPWGLYLEAWARGRFVFDVYRFSGHMAHYVVYITGWILPWPLVFLFMYWYLRGRNNLSLTQNEASTVNLYILVISITLLFLSATFVWIYFSYIVQLVPLLTVILALIVVKIWERFRTWGYVLVVLLVATNVLHTFPYFLPVTREFKWASLAPRRYLAETDALIELAGHLRFDLANYLYELTHDYDGPDEGIVLFLREHASPGDIVLTSYGELPIVFYTGLDIAGGLSAYRLDQVKQPEWVIDRREGFYREAIAQVIASGDYEAIEIPYPDILWGNRPVPEYHKFATVRDVPNVIIYHRKVSN